MPYVTPYPANLPTLEEARSLAFQAMIVASLDDLNASLAMAGLPAGGLVITPAQVVIGDPDTIPTTLICVEEGGDEDPRAMEIDPSYFMPRSNKSGPLETLYTNIFVYLGHKDLLSSSPVIDTQNRSIALSRIMGHLRKRVFNSQAGAVITLTSQEHRTDTGFDELKDGHIRSVNKGKKPKFGGKSVYVDYAHLLHVCWIA